MRLAPRQEQVYQRKDLAKPPAASKPLPKALTAPAQAAGVPFEDSRGCMWPLWGFESTIGNVCGCAQKVLDEGTKRERTSSYCETHHRRAYPGSR